MDQQAFIDKMQETMLKPSDIATDLWLKWAEEFADTSQYENEAKKAGCSPAEYLLDGLYTGLFHVKMRYGEQVAQIIYQMSQSDNCLYPYEMLDAARYIKAGFSAEQVGKLATDEKLSDIEPSIEDALMERAGNEMKPVRNPYADIPFCVSELQKVEQELGGSENRFAEWMQFAFETADNLEVRPAEYTKELCESFRYASGKYGKEIACAIFDLIELEHGALLPNEIRQAAAFLHCGGSIDKVPQMAYDGEFMEGPPAEGPDGEQKEMRAPSL